MKFRCINELTYEIPNMPHVVGDWVINCKGDPKVELSVPRKLMDLLYENGFELILRSPCKGHEPEVCIYRDTIIGKIDRKAGFHIYKDKPHGDLLEELIRKYD
jgi:hypothetical protein